MTTHYETSDLLEHYYVPDERGHLASHLRQCLECAGRFEALKREMSAAAEASRSEASSRPEWFWSRQRMAIRRRIEEGGRSRFRSGWLRPRTWSYSLAGILLVAAAILTLRSDFGRDHRAQVRTTHSIAQTTETSSPDSSRASAMTDDETLLGGSRTPWSDDAISDFHPAVEWESWLETTDGESNPGGTS
ncbi:MAG: hypothetical protein WBX15_19925 [Thermoanaerobaculia bacterium]